MNQPLIDPGFSQVGHSLVRELGKYLGHNQMISLAGGYPGADLFDQPGLQQALDWAMTRHPVACLQYGPSDGLPMLRDVVAQWMAQCGTPCDSADVLITGGSQQGFDICTRLLIQPGDLAWVERPTYTGPLRRLRLARAIVQGLPTDEHGLVVDAVAQRLATPGQRPPKLLYVVPTFANPSGTTLSLQRRIQLLELAVRYQFVVVEDDPYGALRWQGEHLPHLAALASQVPGAQSWVVHLGSFSKIIAPGLRVAWMKASAGFLQAALLAKQLDDLSNPGLNQVAVCEYIQAGLLGRHLPRIVNAYQQRCQAMLASVDAELGSNLQLLQPDGGMFVWGRLQHQLNSRDLLMYALEEGVTFVCGDVYYADEPDASSIRLSFANPQPEVIRTGMARLNSALRRLQDPNDQAQEIPALRQAT